MYNKMFSRLPELLEFLEGLGFEFPVDWDGEIEAIFYPPDLTAARIAAALGEHRQAIEAHLERRRRSALRVFVGGPYNGKRHGQYRYSARHVLAFHIGRARWAVYQYGPDWLDGRLFFKGWATSEKKARRLQLVK